MTESKVTYLARIQNLDVGMDIYGRVTLHFDHGFVKDGPLLIGECGRGKTVEDAAEDYYRTNLKNLVNYGINKGSMI